MAWEWLQTFGEYTLNYNPDTISSPDQMYVHWSENGVVVGNIPSVISVPNSGGTDAIWNITETFYLRNYGQEDYAEMEVWSSGTKIGVGAWAGQHPRMVSNSVWINHELQQAKPVGAFKNWYDNSYFAWGYVPAWGNDTAKSEAFYQIITNPPITYQWQSVPSISGKNGILQSLSTLVNINDGNPVSGASASAVNIIPASVVSGMIQTGASDVIVSFEIPQLTSGTYDSIKLVGKRGGIPRSKTDGEFIETLSDSDTSKTLTGLTKGYTYWFVIFAEDSKGSSSESDPYPYETGEGESVAFFEIDLGQGGKDIVRYDASKSIGSHKQGELYGNYSIANDELSTNGYIYWDYDATENPKSIPADCCLYFEYDTLFTGGEGYLDWFVLDSNNDQQIYWCYDTKYAFQSDKWYNCLVVAEVKNGYIKRYKYVLDGIEIAHDTANIKMPCTDAEGSIGISEIYFRTTRPTKIKNMSIYYDFSTYTDAGGGGGGGGSGASGSNSVS